MRPVLLVDLARVTGNYNIIKSVFKKQVTAVVKADGYGLGAKMIATALSGIGCKSFAVATIEEAIKLRTAGISGEILVLGYTPPSFEREIINYDLTQTIADAGHLRGFSDKKTKVAVALNVGMNRYGVNAKDVSGVLRFVSETGEKTTLTGVYAHFSYHRVDGELYFREVDTFRSVAVCLNEMGVRTSVPTAVAGEKDLLFDAVRAGIMLYGYAGGETELPEGILGAASLFSEITLIRTVEKGESVGYGGEFVAKRRSRIAVVSIGYADGLSRSLTGLYVSIKGVRAKIVGRICMDVCFIDVTDIKNVAVGDRVTFFGDDIPLSDLSEKAGTIDHEIICRIGKRVAREYV